MIDYKAKAKEATEGSKIFKGRTKMNTDDLIARFPDGVTVTEFDVINGQKGSYPVFAIKEDATICFNGGKIAMDIVNGWLDEAEGDIDAASDGLKEYGGVKMRLAKKKTKNGNTITAIEIV